MITIPVVRASTPDGDLLSPAQPIPVDVIAIICDGDNYVVYEVGDEVPKQG